jgi:hypothetical protein
LIFSAELPELCEQVSDSECSRLDVIEFGVVLLEVSFCSSFEVDFELTVRRDLFVDDLCENIVLFVGHADAADV